MAEKQLGSAPSTSTDAATKTYVDTAIWNAVITAISGDVIIDGGDLDINDKLPAVFPVLLS